MSSFEANGIKSPMSNGNVPESSLAKRSNPVKRVQFHIYIYMLGFVEPSCV